MPMKSGVDGQDIPDEGELAGDILPPLDGYDEDEAAAVREARKYRPLGRLDPMAVIGGVSVHWLSTVFRQPPHIVRARLAKAPIVRISGRSGPLYDVGVAASYLVEPKQQVADWLSSAPPAKINEVLPVRYQPQFWTALKHRLAAMEAANELWRREHIEAVMMDMLSALREALMAFPQDMERRLGLSPQQYEEVKQAVREVMRVAEKAVRRVVSEAAWESYAAELDRVIEAADAMRKRGAGLVITEDEQAMTELVEMAEKEAHRKDAARKGLDRLTKGKRDERKG